MSFRFLSFRGFAPIEFSKVPIGAYLPINVPIVDLSRLRAAQVKKHKRIAEVIVPARFFIRGEAAPKKLRELRELCVRLF